MTTLQSIVTASQRIAATGSRIAKRDAIAACLRGCAPAEIEIAVAYLSGEVRQGRIGIGHAALRGLRGGAAAGAPAPVQNTQGTKRSVPRW